MASLQLTHAPILNSSAQLLVLPVNNAGLLLDPILARSKNLYPDNYQRYFRACRDGSLMVGSCLMRKRAREQAGLGVSSNGSQPSYIANLVVSDHPYHSPRTSWLSAALVDLQQQLIPLIRYQGIRRIALLARPLIAHYSQKNSAQNNIADNAEMTTPIALDWHSDILPLINQHLQDLPRLRIDIHLPKDISI